MKASYKKLKQVFTQNLFVKPSVISLDKNLSKDLAISSLEFWLLVASVENGFQIDLPDAELAKVRTVRDLVGLIERTKA
jgi:acyl carrier protein